MGLLRFTTSWAMVFLISYTALSFTGVFPSELKEIHKSFFSQMLNNTPDKSVEADFAGSISTSSAKLSESILPERIIIDKIGVNASVNNPESRDIKVLDEALLSGVVRYPGSGGLEDVSNMFLFGHSTNWNVVQNLSYKSFNRLGELQIGDLIKIYSGTSEYRYRVISVSQVNKDKALVELSSEEKLVTLSTCDSFGERSDRFVVQARLLEVLPYVNK